MEPLTYGELLRRLQALDLLDDAPVFIGYGGVTYELGIDRIEADWWTPTLLPHGPTCQLWMRSVSGLVRPWESSPN